MTTPNYIVALLAALRDQPAKPGTVEVVRVMHDEHCRIFRRGVCDCDPAIVRQHPPGAMS